MRAELVEPLLRDPVGAELRLPRRQRHTGGVRAVVLRHVRHQGAPATADVEQPLAGLELDLLRDDLELPPLRVLEGVRRALEEGGRVDHDVAEEGVEEVVPPVVVAGDRLPVRRLGVDQDGGDEPADQELHLLPGEPVVEDVLLAPEEGLQIPADLELTRDVLLHEGAHRELLPVGGGEVDGGRGRGGLQGCRRQEGSWGFEFGSNGRPQNITVVAPTVS